MLSTRFVVLLLAYVCTSTAGLILMRSELRRPDAVLVSLDAITNVKLVLGIVLYGLSFFFWLLAVSRFELTTAYPFFIGLGYTSVTVFAVLILGESFDVQKGVGVVLVGVGLLLVATG